MNFRGFILNNRVLKILEKWTRKVRKKCLHEHAENLHIYKSIESKGYAWEGSFERSWDGIEEDETGALKIHVQKAGDKARMRRQEMMKSVRKGLIRYVYVVVDLSKGMSQKDWKPHRCAVVSEEVQTFIKDYFDQNPISQLGLIGIKSATAEKLSDLSGNPKHHVEKMRASLTAHGEPSLQNALDMAKNALKTAPSYGSKEIVVIYGSLTTTDPGDIFATIASLKRENIRCSFIGIGAEMHLLHRIAQVRTLDIAYHTKIIMKHAFIHSGN